MTSTPTAFKGKGTLWNMAHMLDYVMRPNAKLRSLLRNARRAARLRPGSVGVHIRRGEACDPANARFCGSPEEVLVAVRTVLDKYNATSAYIATDDPSVIGQLQRLAPDVHWSFLESFNRTQLNQGWTQILLTRMGQLDRRVVAESTFLDLFLLSECSFLVRPPPAS
ncbi:hypothetical protein T484DRAFT_1877449 [Baffinella frigidus]|nr:hypothetical protein T484DRAFT_1877449 [Cryptophyta sp. CCMP2293]